MSKYKGYHFFIGDLELPYAPSELTINIGSNNQTVSLIDGNEINILKTPKLTEIEFDIELPRGRQYAFANDLKSPIQYTDYFETLMTEKTPTKLIITRPAPNGSYGTTANGFASNEWTVTLEGYEMKESAENAFDITVSLKFKQYIEYGTAKKTIKNNSNKAQVVQETPKTVTKTENYTVRKGDTLWKISKAKLGVGSSWEKIYYENKSVIEATAIKYGKKDSNKGWWIYPGTVLRIPATKK